MNSQDVLLLGVKGSVLAFHRTTGEHLWATELKSSSTDFVTLISDDTCVFAHTGGELFGLELLTGNILWRDGLKGFGYGLSSLGFPGGASVSPTAEAIRQAAAAAAPASHTAQVANTTH